MSVFDDLTPTTRHRFDLWLPPDAVIAAMAQEGDPIPTGWPILDRQLRNGGISPGRIVTVGGPPFAGKTTIVCSIALQMALRVPVYALFSDEGRAQAALRMGVMLGVPLEEIEADPVKAGQRVAELLGERSIQLLKPDEEEATAETVIQRIRAEVPSLPAVVLLDSAQTIRASIPAEDREEPPRIAVKRLMASCRSWAASYGLTFILTSQSNRASFRSKKTDENTVAMASFSESSAIEFMSDVAVVLSLPDDAGTVKVEVVKNRLRPANSTEPRVFHVRYDAYTGRMLEIDPAEVEVADHAASTERLRPAKSKVSHELKTSTEGLTSAQVAELAKVRKAVAIECLSALESDRRVFHKKDGRQILYFWIAE